MTNSRLMWVSVSTRGSLFVAKSDTEPTLLITAPSRDVLMSLIPRAIVDLFDRTYGEKVVVYPLEADNDLRQAVAVVPTHQMAATA